MPYCLSRCPEKKDFSPLTFELRLSSTCFPLCSLFDPSTDGENLKRKQFEKTLADIRHLRDTNNINVIDPGKGIFSVVCSETTCKFEFTIFEYKGVTEYPQNLPPTFQGPIQTGETSQAGNITLIIPSQMLTPLDQTNIQKFMDGSMAIQLQTRTPQNPIQFILPTCTFTLIVTVSTSVA